jgi:hypothetical protein
MKPIIRTVVLAKAFLLFTLLFSANPSFAGETKGTLTHPRGTVALKFSYFIKGPDALDPQKIIERLVLSGNDLSGKIQGCGTMSCVDGAVTEAVSIDLISGPRYNYWMAINGALVQNSGTVEPSVIKTTAKDAKHIAGKISMDATTMGGPKVEADFDAPLAKAFTH